MNYSGINHFRAEGKIIMDMVDWSSWSSWWWMYL